MTPAESRLVSGTVPGSAVATASTRIRRQVGHVVAAASPAPELAGARALLTSG